MPESRKEYFKAWFQANKERWNAKCREYRSKNRDKYRNIVKEWYKTEAGQAYLKSEKRALTKKISSKKTKLKYPERDKARRKLRDAVKAGKIKRLPCEVCSTTIDIQAHHTDYSRPFDVKWLCRSHHMMLHRT